MVRFPNQSFLIVSPVSIKIYLTTDFVSLYNSPSFTVGGHVTINISSSKMTSILTVHLVDSRRCFTEWKVSEVTTTVNSYSGWTAFSLELVVLLKKVITILISIDQ